MGGLGLASGSQLVRNLTAAWLGLQVALIQMLKVQRWPSPAWLCTWIHVCYSVVCAVVLSRLLSALLPASKV